MRFSREIIATSLIAATALSLSFARRTDLYEARSPIPAALFMPREGKRLACFITINSDDEKGVFTRYLNPEEWDLVELTEPASNGGKSGWFDSACKKNFHCDIDVISGHFAGRFFGSSGYTLGLNDLESHSCAQDCKGILENPREVYLFGCKALATKERDHRTPQQYFQVLVDDGYPPETARRVVEDRYGAFGQDNRGKIQRAFSGVPYIYGFFSTAPLGKDLKPILESYMRKLGSFTEHFDSIVKRGISAKKEFNPDLQNAMAGQSFTQCSGLDPKDPEYTFHKQICALFDASVPLVDRLLSVDMMLNSDKVLMLLPSIENFMRSNLREIKSSQADIFSRMKGNQNARKILLDTLLAVKTPITKIEWMRFAHMMDWVTRDDLVQVVYQLVDSAFSDDSFDADVGNTICSLGVAGVDQLDYTQIIPKIRDFHFSTESAANAMRCAGFARYPEFRSAMAKIYRARKTFSRIDTGVVSTIFSDTAPVLDPTSADRELLSLLGTLCDRYPLGTGSATCGRALSRLGATDDATASLLVKLLRAGDPSLQMAFASTLYTMRAGLDLIETAMVDLYLDSVHPHPYWYGLERYFQIQPIRGDSNQKRVLAYLVNRTDARRPDEMVFGLREMKLTPSELSADYTAIRSKPNVLITSRVFMGFLSLANRAESDPAFIEMLFDQHRAVSVTSDEDLRSFYETLKLPAVRQTLKKSKIAQTAVCEILKTAETNLGLDDYGDVVARKVSVKPCQELVND